ncbi:MAG: OsmC family protein [Opitutaceae bacterium]|nr:OsmC family protein [Cytophagales bacterium]
MGNFNVIYLGQLRCEATHNASGTKILTDAPVDNHGRGEAFSPTDLVCTALATCVITTIGIWAGKENIELNGTTIDVSKTMQGSPRKIARIDLILNVTGSLLTENQKSKLEEIAHHCPVAISLHPDIVQNMEFNY